MKKRSETQTLRSQKFSSRRRPHSRGRGRTNI